MPRDLNQMMEGGYKTMGGPTQPADDSAGRTIGATDQNQKDQRGIKRDGNTYVETASDGSKVWYPAKHFDNGLRVGFPTKEEAEAANSMSEDELQRYQATAGKEQGQGLDQSVGMGRGGSGMSLPGT